MNQDLFAFITFLIGLFVGHRFNLYRDRRKEFNEVVLRLKVAFQNPMHDMTLRFDKEDWVLFLHLVGTRKRSACTKAMEDYESECRNTTTDSLGQSYYSSPEKVKAAITRLDRLCQLK